MSGAAAARRRQHVDELCAATLRAATGDRGLHFRGRRLWRDEAALPRGAAHLEPSFEAGDELGSFRGAADGWALRLLHGDAALHRRLAPAEPHARWVFELLEQLRVESLAELPGVRANLRHRFEQWSSAFQHSGLTETEPGLLLYTLAQVARSRVTGEPVVEATEGLIEATRMALGPLLGSALAGLRRERHDAAAYAAHALAIARQVAARLAALAADGDTRRGDGRDDDEAGRRGTRFALWLDFDGSSEHGIATATGGDRRAGADAAPRYRIFTTAHDQELRPATRVRAALLDEDRRRIDGRIAELGLQPARLARDLRALLARPVIDGWDDGEEEGLVDARRLAQLVASPTERRVFRRPREQAQADAAFALLVDCSGSMRHHAEAVAALADTFVRALEDAGASAELLGFTTGAWNGGRALRDWQRAGRPRDPGRLAERCHLVFKDAATPWRRARRDIAALLKTDLYREGIDGEAVAWAAARLLAREARRRLLLVISDGSPMDSATALANDAQYLDRHLREVVARHEAGGAVEIVGIGVGLDLSPFYRRSVALDPQAGLGPGALREIVRAVGRAHTPAPGRG